METTLFDFTIPEDRIAGYPAEKRDESLLMVLNRYTESVAIYPFYEIERYLDENDIIVLNNSKVLPAQLFAKRVTGGIHEVLLLHPLDSKNLRWNILIKAAKKIRPGDVLTIDDQNSFRLLNKTEEDSYWVEFNHPMDETRLATIGRVPLPPYIRKIRDWEPADEERYQTVYARKTGSIASPTAGLHFTPALIQKLTDKGVVFLETTLHVSLGTFRPIKTDAIEDHPMEDENFEISVQVAKKINESLQKKRIIATGTTVTRTLESSFHDGNLISGIGKTNLFITPGYQFKVVNAIITNFHLPKSTPFILACSFASLDLMKKAYRVALDSEIKFYSFGDAMLII